MPFTILEIEILLSCIVETNVVPVNLILIYTNHIRVCCLTNIINKRLLYKLKLGVKLLTFANSFIFIIISAIINFNQ